MVDGPNLYLYCGNDPVNLVDAWGLCGESLWDQMKYKYFRVFEGTQWGGGVGVKIKLKLFGCLDLNFGVHDITGSRITKEGITDFTEFEAGASAQMLNFKASMNYKEGNINLSHSWKFDKISSKDLLNYKLKLGGTVPNPYNGTAANAELHINLNELF